MVNNKMLLTELQKNSLDKEMLEIELDNSKRHLAEEMASISYRTLATKPQTRKKPMKIKIQNFIERVKILLGL